MTIPDFTIFCAVDASHVDELRLSYPTWRKHKPSLCESPLLVLCDLFTSGAATDWWSAHQSWWKDQLAFLHDHPGGVSCRFISHGKEWPVRERMLSSFVFGAEHIQTPYYLKLDADTIATGCDNWVDPHWFDDSPAIIASPWGYTKPAGMVADFNKWADQCREQFPLPLDYRVSGLVARHLRIISYAMFGSTNFTRRMAKLAGGRLPVPSQDTFLGACATRSGAKIIRAKMGELGWRHIGGGGRRLEEAAQQAMEGAAV